jgi:apolipoprotein N-acyltransferase
VPFVRRHWSAIAAALSGLLFAAATPPIDFQPGILLGLVVFAYALSGTPHATRVRGGAIRGLLFGFAANLEALRFVPEVLSRFTPLPFVANWLALVLLSAAQALPWAAGGALAQWLATPPAKAAARSGSAFARFARMRPPTAAWLAFGVGVYVATFVPSIFPWTPAGGLARWPVLLQTAELIGERGTSFLVAIGCGLAAEAALAYARWRRSQSRGQSEKSASADATERRGGREIATAGATFVVLFLYGAIRVQAIDAMRMGALHARVALLQPDFDAFFRWDAGRSTMMMTRLTELTKRAEADGAELTVWPESAYPYTLAHGTKSSPYGPRAVLQPGVHGPVLTGVYLTKGESLGTNSAILVARGGAIAPSYDKRHLLWFGETVPMADTFPVLRRVFARGTGLVPGTESVALSTGPIVAAVLNCYEDTLPAAGREAMDVRPNLLVNVTNDAWFAGSAEGELHLRLAVLRTIETRRDLVRAVNRGPTSWVDAAGRIRARHDPTPGWRPPPLVVDAALLDGPPTLYTRAGDAPLAIIILGAIVVPWVRARRRARVTA